MKDRHSATTFRLLPIGSKVWPLDGAVGKWHVAGHVDGRIVFKEWWRHHRRWHYFIRHPWDPMLLTASTRIRRARKPK